MCLLSKNRLPRIAWKPIKVYKIVYFENSTYYTPYYYYKLKHKNLINVSNTLLNIIFNIKRLKYYEYSDCYKVNNGFFHSFYDKIEALYKRKCIAYRDWTKDYTVIECTIPKFSLYYIGVKGDICSNRLNTEFKII